MAALQRAPVRQTEIVYPTPLISDVLFSELVDTTRSAVPAYGTAHPNTAKWPHHSLVLAREANPQDSGGRDGVFEFFYAAARENQDLYNFTHTNADIGNTRFDAVARTYVTLRDSFTPDTPAMGATMPNVPASLFTGTYVLAEKRQTRVEDQELDSLYVAETHVYVKRATIIDNGFNEVLGVNLSRTTTLYYRGETVAGANIETLVADDKNAYWGTQVSLKISRSGEQLSDNWFAVIEQQITLKRNTNGSLTDDWPIGQIKRKVRENPTPQKFRRHTEVVETATPIDLPANNVDNLPSPLPPTGDQVEVRVAKINDYRYERTVTTETIDTDGTLTGTEWVPTFGGGVMTTEETISPEGALASGAFGIITSKVTPIGDGKIIKEVGTMSSFPMLSGSKFDADLDIDLPFTEQVVPAGTNNPGSDTEPIDEFRSKVRTADRAAIRASLGSIHLTLPSQENIQLPNVLKSVSVLASRSVGNGNSYGWGNSYSGSNDSTIAVSADLTYEIEEGYSGPISSEIHVFFLPLNGASKGDILSAVDAEAWPTYRPTSSRIVITGNGAQRSFSEAISDNSSSANESYSVSAFTSVGVLPATLHGSMDIDVTYSDFLAPTGLLDATWATNVAANEARVDALRAALNAIPPTYAGEEVTPLQKQFLLAKFEALESTMSTATDFTPEDAEVTVVPNTLEATFPSEIQYGRYVVSSNASVYGYGMVRVTAVVVDLSNLAP